MAYHGILLEELCTIPTSSLFKKTRLSLGICLCLLTHRLHKNSGSKMDLAEKTNEKSNWPCEFASFFVPINTWFTSNATPNVGCK